jgi:hypothetical protein
MAEQGGGGGGGGGTPAGGGASAAAAAPGAGGAPGSAPDRPPSRAPSVGVPPPPGGSGGGAVAADTPPGAAVAPRGSGSGSGGPGSEARRSGGKGGKQAPSASTELFAHLQQYRPITVEAILQQKEAAAMHPAIVGLALRYADGSISGGTARCVALLHALGQVRGRGGTGSRRGCGRAGSPTKRNASSGRAPSHDMRARPSPLRVLLPTPAPAPPHPQLVADYKTPPGKSLPRDLMATVNAAVDFLVRCRPLGVSMGNAIKFLKLCISKIDPNGAPAKGLAREGVGGAWG